MGVVVVGFALIGDNDEGISNVVGLATGDAVRGLSEGLTVVGFVVIIEDTVGLMVGVFTGKENVDFTVGDAVVGLLVGFSVGDKVVGFATGGVVGGDCL